MIPSKWTTLLTELKLPDYPHKDVKWTDCLVVNSVATIPAGLRASEYPKPNRGCNLILLGRKGVPQYFVKVRPAWDQRLIRATGIRERLCNDPILREVVPWTKGLRNREVTIQASKMVPGHTFDRIMPNNADRWRESVNDILRVTSLLTKRSVALLPDLSVGGGGIDVANAAVENLEYLATLGFPRRHLDSLEAVLRSAGTLPSIPQHGDLWPSNIVRYRRRWWLLDYEDFGQIRVPLYDMYHLLRSCMVQQTRRAEALQGPVWVEMLSSANAAAATGREIIGYAARELSLEPRQVLGTLGYYLSDIAVRIRRRGNPQAIYGPFLEDLVSFCYDNQSFLDSWAVW